jgi:hypothetical protein
MAERRTYRQTDTGRKAWESRSSGLPPAYRRILGLLQSAACCDDILAGMPECRKKQVQDWLDELETLCFIEVLPFAGTRESAHLSQAA